MNSNSIDLGRLNGLFSSSFVGNANGALNNEQNISDNNSFIFTIKTDTTAGVKTFQLPLISNGTYNFYVDWGDGRKDYVTSFAQIYPRETVARTHSYREVGTYKIKITGICRGFSFFGLGEQPKILSVERFGCLELLNDTISGRQFGSCNNLNFDNLKDTLNTKNLTNLNFMFVNCSNLTKFNLINNWNVSNVNDMSFLFNGTLFNEFIGNWNVSNVYSMKDMFSNNNAFNQPIEAWNVSNVTNMSGMFNNNSAFNQNIGNWNVSLVSLGGFDNFMNSKTPSTFSASNLDAIYNGWVIKGVQEGLSISFGTANHTSASLQTKELLARPTYEGGFSITSVTNSGGNILISIGDVIGSILLTGNKIVVSGYTGSNSPNGVWEITRIGDFDFLLVGSVYGSDFAGSGNLRTGYAWTIIDGGQI